MNIKKFETTINNLINIMLEPYGVDMEWVKKHDYIDGTLWCSYLTWTHDESEAFKKLFIDTLRKEVRMTKKAAEKEWAWFFIMWGLKTDDKKAVIPEALLVPESE